MSDLESQAQYKAPQLGRMRNAMGFLSKNGKNLRPKILREVSGFGGVELAATLRKPRQYLYKEEIPLEPSKKLKARIMDLVVASDLAFELLGENENETRSWLMSPSEILFGESPFEACLRGAGKNLIEWLKARTRGEPGEAY